MPDSVIICECFARDGLQHEDVLLPTDRKVGLIDAFTRAGFPRIEATSYSHPAQLPAFSDASDVLARILRRAGTAYKATCPNLRAVRRAVADHEGGHGAEELSLLVSATESHTERNLRTTRHAQWDAVAGMVAAAGGRFRLVGVISVALGCPFEGPVDPGSVADDIARFAELGVTHVALGDTAGFGTSRTVRTLFRRAAALPGVTPIAHFHDSRGTGLVNCMAAVEEGCRWLDSAMGGVGGHPTQIRYGGGYTGNVATEDLVNLLEAEGLATGLDLDAVAAASRLCEAALGRELESRVARAGFGHLPQRKTIHA